jgi:hypothetical protein
MGALHNGIVIFRNCIYFEPSVIHPNEIFDVSLHSYYKINKF